MNPIESITQAPPEAISLGKEYLQKSEAYYKLKIFQQLSYMTSAFAKLLFIGGFLFIGLVFLAVAGAIVLSDLLGSIVYGCLLIALATFICAIVVYRLRKSIDSKVISKISKTYFN